MTKRILLTGATGFLGTQVARKLLSFPDFDLIVLVRAKSDQVAVHRIRREWWGCSDLRAEIGLRVQVWVGDITQDHLGLSDERYHLLANQVTHIIHCAADVRLFAPSEELHLINVTGTQHVLELALAAHRHHGLERFAHVSTAYVAGERSGPVTEDELSDRYGFSNGYERSKYDAEMLVRQVQDHLPVTIFRPGMIVGDSKTGAVKNFNTLYYPLRLYLTGRLRAAPARSSFRVNLVPVDYVAGAISTLTFNPQAQGKTFHLTPPLQDMPVLDELIEAVRLWAGEEMGLKLKRPIYLPWLLPDRLVELLGKLTDRDLANLLRLFPYFRKQPVFDRTNTDRLLGPYPHRWREMMPALLSFAVRYSFWHRVERTVYEQIMFRLQSQSKPVRYHDFIGKGPDEKVVHYTSREIYAQVWQIARSLRSLGIRPGDRVAVLGLNNTRYFSILMACGLIGAVSTPLYASCPPREIEHLLKDCHARLFLVGAPGILKRRGEIDFDGVIVSFCREDYPDPDGRRIYRWNEFLELGESEVDTEIAEPVELDGPAVLYYTSGTTGRPKAVVYRHEQLRWLGETLASMYPWHERNRWGSYLSYLPVSHVVEGILAMYSPYYVPASLDIYFLEEFSMLQGALQKARPTIFFSVPRFFEKVRDALLANPLARTYLKLPDGFLRDVLRVILRRGLLRKAGLNGCRQMMVGSAPSDPELLAFYQELGVEVHNAYGLTEAPLISLNRLGDNRVGTLGRPLPETEIRQAASGEIEVRGPQVAAGYLVDDQIQPFKDGWFGTGDMGVLTPDGYLLLGGRRNDVIITSYAKKINPATIEARLRSIPGMAEVMVIGDGRPYCAALLWVEEETLSPAMARCIDESIATINSNLSHPEQIRRWAVLSGSLTVENGSLTGSMKVKRAVVVERLAGEIEALYRGETVSGMLYSHGIY